MKRVPAMVGVGAERSGTRPKRHAWVSGAIRWLPEKVRIQINGGLSNWSKGSSGTSERSVEISTRRDRKEQGKADVTMVRSAKGWWQHS